MIIHNSHTQRTDDDDYLQYKATGCNAIAVCF